MTEGSRRGRRARRIIRALSKLADREEVAWCMVRREQVLDAFGDPANKHEIALAVAELFPELSHRLPRKRKAWMSEDERAGIFDAAAFALTVLGGLSLVLKMGQGRLFCTCEADRSSHLYHLIGRTGTGKSTLLSTMAFEKTAAGDRMVEEIRSLLVASDKPHSLPD